MSFAGSREPPTLLGRPATEYLDRAAAELADAKSELHRMLPLAPGQRVLDVGCGTGMDVQEMARRVGPDGRAHGVDVSERAVAEARARAVGAGLPAEFQVGTATGLPFADGEFDACRAERVLQHVDDPGRAATEMLRVTRPGGHILACDPDHGMWAPDSADPELTRTLLTWWFGHVPHPWSGRRLPGLLRAAGADDVRIAVVPVVLRGLAAADAVTGILRAVGQAAGAGVVPADRAAAWEDDARARDAEGAFVMLGAMVAALGRRTGP